MEKLKKYYIYSTYVFAIASTIANSIYLMKLKFFDFMILLISIYIIYLFLNLGKKLNLFILCLFFLMQSISFNYIVLHDFIIGPDLRLFILNEKDFTVGSVFNIFNFKLSIVDATRDLHPLISFNIIHLLITITLFFDIIKIKK
ncbi:Hypothetical transmembrane protein [Flavobacterium indicum GPTSA100-9 = DSM 17447]|uniref:Hypothetical transmembrane protein n=1 Tax=Flavobacterium indicum (strain DSM 17447 / CIP 109464 / GPTSA100-9) TaxID=1094466 RepID=H8XNH6_FLAIG|nr:hypothetical protein [Flavobacterium indicum]CCG52093.1 Hypothetical transmembrane protein [Flavobacterium indicum GPTSA100-9 = DSM 17447]